MICSRCQCQLERDAKTCSQCGQDVVPAMQLDFPCVLCGAPIPAGVEECPHCGKISNGHLPGADAPSPAPVVEPMDTPEPVPVELEAFQLDVVAFQAAPPPPVPRAPVVEFFEPLPTLLHVDEPPESVPTSVSVKASAPAVAPAPPVSIVLPVVPAKPVQAKVVESPVPAAPPAVVAETRTETKAETFKAPLPPSRPGPRTVPVWPTQEEETLGPQPEDVIDEDELCRRRALRQLVLVVVLGVVGLGTWGYLMRARPWVKPAVQALSTQAPTAAVAGASVPAAMPAAGSAPSPEAESLPPPTATPKPAPAERPVVKPAVKPARPHGEEDAYLRQIRRQLERH